MKYLSLFLISMIWFFTGCEKEKQPEPSYLEQDWFTITDNPDDPLQHRVYELFSEWGIPVFYNDTIGRQERGTDLSGNPVIFHRRLDLNYNLNNPENAFSLKAKHISLITEKEDILAGIEFVDKKLLPVIPPQFYIHSILLVDSLYEKEYGTIYPLSAYRGMEALAIADVPAIAKMTEDKQKNRVNEIAIYLTINYLANHESEDLVAFRQESYDPALEKSIYGLEACKPRYPGYLCVKPDRWEVYGFLDYDHSRSASITDPDPANWYYRLVKEEEDIETFIMAVLSQDENDFMIEYAAYPKVLKKYQLIRNLLTTIGFKL